MASSIRKNIVWKALEVVAGKYSEHISERSGMIFRCTMRKVYSVRMAVTINTITHREYVTDLNLCIIQIPLGCEKVI